MGRVWWKVTEEFKLSCLTLKVSECLGTFKMMEKYRIKMLTEKGQLERQRRIKWTKELPNYYYCSLSLKT